MLRTRRRKRKEDREVREMDIGFFFEMMATIVKLIVMWLHTSVNILKNIKVDEVHSMSMISQEQDFLKKKKYELFPVLFGNVVFNVVVVVVVPRHVSKSLSPVSNSDLQTFFSCQLMSVKRQILQIRSTKLKRPTAEDTGDRH